MAKRQDKGEAKRSCAQHECAEAACGGAGALSASDRTSSEHGCDARVLITLLFCYTITLFLVNSLAGMALMSAILLATSLLLRVSISRVLKSALPSYPLAFFIALYQLVAGDFIGAAVIALRVILLVYGSLTLAFATSVTELQQALDRMLSPLARLGIPTRDISTASGIALRFIPLIGEEFNTVRAAQLSRGAALDTGGAMQRISAWGGLFSPIIVGLFRRADTVATAMDTRCYGSSSRPTYLNSRKLTVRDLCVLVIGIFIFTAIALLF